MSIRAAVLLGAAFFASVAHADIQCSPTTIIGSQARTRVKHRPTPNVSAKTASVVDVIAWPVPPLNDASVRRSNDPLSGEERVVTLTGDLWRVKVEDNDCDFHLEVSAPGGTDSAPRIIVEVPQEHTALRNALIKAVKDSGRGDLTSRPQIDFEKSLPITVTGLAFLDATHWSARKPKVGSGHGTQFVSTLWEVHPVFGLAVTSAPASAPTVVAHGTLPPRPDHIVVVIEENKDYGEIIGSPNAPYLNSLLPDATLLTASYALHHPSQPNYLELFSGDEQNVCTDHCPPAPLLNGPNLADSLIKANRSFIGFAENLPGNPRTCSMANDYARKHCPWVDFGNVPLTASKDFVDFPKTSAGFSALPAVAYVIPSLIHDMHNLPGGSHNTPTEIHNGDAWLHDHLDAYAQWAMTHNSLLIITWDEDNAQYTMPTSCANGINTAPTSNRIATIVMGEHVQQGLQNATSVTHYGVLRTILDLESLAPIGGAKTAQPIKGIWQ